MTPSRRSLRAYAAVLICVKDTCDIFTQTINFADGTASQEEVTMALPKPTAFSHSPVKEPKFCRCRLCHERFYGETIAQARAACEEHAKRLHPDWHVTTCFCPD